MQEHATRYNNHVTIMEHFFSAVILEEVGC